MAKIKKLTTRNVIVKNESRRGKFTQTAKRKRYEDINAVMKEVLKDKCWAETKGTTKELNDERFIIERNHVAESHGTLFFFGGLRETGEMLQRVFLYPFGSWRKRSY